MPEVRIDQLADDDPRRDLIKLLDRARRATEAFRNTIFPGSRMAADRAATGDTNVDLPAMCEHYIGGSADFLTGLDRLMLPSPNTLQIPRFSLYPLIRGVIESSGQAVWVLGPDEQRVRFLRLLQVQKAELKSDRRWVKVRTGLQDGDTSEVRSTLNSLRRECDRRFDARDQGFAEAAAPLQIDPEEFKDDLPRGYEGLIREAVAEQKLDFQRGRWSAAQWVFVSGLSHPSLSRAWSASIHEPGEVRPDGMLPVWFEPDPITVRDSLGLAVMLHDRSVSLWLEACAAPGSGT